MARNKKVEILSHDGQVLHPITDGDCVIFPDGETLTRKLSEQEEVMYTPEVVNSSPMFKVGEGDSSDYSANVLDGAYQEAVLKGQTYVNTIQEPSADVITLPTPFTEYERTQSKTFTEMQDGTFGLNLVGQSYVNCIQEPSEPSYVALGENLEFQNKKVEYTTDGQIKSAMLKGQTLVNLDKRDRSSYKTLTATGSAVNDFLTLPTTLKTSTKYLIIIDIKEVTIDGTFRINVNSSGNTAFEDIYLASDVIGVGIHKKIVTSKSSFDGVPYALRTYLYTNNTTGYITYRTMILEYQDGMENWEIPYFQGMQSVTMSTELENVCSRYNSGLAKGGKTFTVGTSVNRSLYLSYTETISNYNFKQNTKYLMQFKITNLNLDGADYITLLFSDGTVASGNALFGDYTNTSIKVAKNGIYRTVLTTSNIVSTSHFVIKGLGSEWENSTSTTRKLTISEIMCIEYQNGMENWDLPYFETTQLMKPLKVQSVNKNLANIVTGTIYESTGEEYVSNEGSYYISKDFIKYDPTVKYNFYRTITRQLDSVNGRWFYYDRNKQFLQTISHEKICVGAIPPINTKYMKFRYPKTSWGESLANSMAEFMLLESTDDPTLYQPHQEKITSALEPITLRAIGNVKDTLDLSTGEYVQRIGEVVLDGSDDEGWKMGIYSEGDAYRFDTEIISGKTPLVSNTTLANIMCDKYKPITFSDAYYNRGQGIAIFSNTHIVISNGMTNLDDFKSSLQQNPIKVQYQLANPIVRKISLEYPNLQTYQDITHVQSIAMDGTLIPKIFLPSDISYKAMLKPNTSYNVIVDREVIDSTNQLTVNLGGTTANITANRTIVRTPSTLSNETLTFSGKDNRIAKAMLIEGSTLINGDLPHFDGIGDVKLGRVVENLCMANEISVGGATATISSYNERIESKITVTGSKVFIFPLTKHLLNNKRYFIYCPYDYQYTIYGFRHEYNNSLSYTYQSCEGVNKKYAIIRIDGNQQKNPYTHFTVGCHGNMPVNTTMTIRRPIICEYIDGMENWDWESIGYFTGTRNIGNEFMRISNSDKTKYNSLHIAPNEQIPLTFEQGATIFSTTTSFAEQSNNTMASRIRTGLLDLEPNETYRISCGDKNYIQATAFYNNSNIGAYTLGGNSDDCIFTTTKDVHKICINIAKSDLNSNITPSVLHQVRLEKVTDVTLRSIGDVKDELDLTRGVYIQRMYEVKLNGFEDWSIHNAYSTDNHLCFYWGYKKIPSYDYNKFGQWGCVINVTPLLIPRGWNSFYGAKADEEGVTFNGDNKQNITIKIRKDRLSSQDVNGFKQWLQSNPITVQYPLETPIEHKINIPMKNELNQTIAKPNGVFTLPLMYSETNHVDINSQIYPKVQSRDYISYPVIASPSQQYTVFHNKVVSTDLTVNLCGASTTVNTHKNTVTTPSSISQYELRLSGANNKVSNVCVFNGDYMNVNVPYVQGMMNAANPTVKNVGKNLFDISKLTKTNYNSIDIAKRTIIMNPTGQLQNGGEFRFKVKKNEKYVCSVNIDGSNQSARIEIRHYNDGQQNTSVVDLCTSRKTFTAVGNEIKITISNGTQTSQCIFRNIQIEETSTPSQYEPYKENICEPKNGVIELTEDMFEQGSMGGVNGANYDKSTSVARIRTKELIKVSPSTNYIFKMNSDYNVWIKEFDKQGKQLDTSIVGWLNNGVFTTKNNVNYISFIIRKGTNNTSISVSEFDNINPYLCELDKEIHLRSLPNGVRDELNLETGEYIQRVGEVVLDGSEDEAWSQHTGGDKIYYATSAFTDVASLNTSGSARSVMCDKLTNNYTGNSTVSSSYNKYSISCLSGNLNGFAFSLDHTTPLAEAKLWLQANPITVQYQLKTPIIKHVDVHNYPHSYKDGHVIIENNDPTTSIPAQLTYKCVTNRSGQIQEHTEQVEKQERQINELETLILENIRQNQNRSQNFLTSLISTLEIEEE